MPTLAAVLIVCNEARNLAAALQSVQFADEIIVVDSGSTDATLAIARRYTNKVYSETNWQGFGVQRQRAQAQATADWILMLDADERVTPELQAEIQRIVAANDLHCVYAVPRLSWVFGRFIRHSGWYPDYVVRLYPRNAAGYDDSAVHEKVIYAAPLQRRELRGDLLHYTYRDMEHYLVKSAAYAAAWAAQRHAQGRRSSLLQATLHGIGCFVKMYLLRLGFLDGRQGLLLALLSAHSTFVKYADLWTRSRQLPPP
jgi:(heptosyl)LPS beta-1,4-glucosyltransferase